MTDQPDDNGWRSLLTGWSSVRTSQGSQREDTERLWVVWMTTVPVLHLMLFWRPGPIVCSDFLILPGIFLLWGEREQEKKDWLSCFYKSSCINIWENMAVSPTTLLAFFFFLYGVFFFFWLT